MKKHILVTGGAGYIGSHIVAELVAANYEVSIVDDLSNSSPEALSNLEKLLGVQLPFYQVGLADTAAIDEILSKNQIDGVIHFAASKYVGESVEDPLLYYRNNVSNFVSFLEQLRAHNINHFVFSSSAAVYGNPPISQVTEETPCAPESPYGQSKLMDETILRDLCAATPSLHGTALRYFNVVGSHDSVKIGELPKNTPQNLLPIIVRAVAGTMPPLTIYGDDYETPDGTCLRDYIHVVDLAKAHVAALDNMFAQDQGSYRVYNISSGKPTSVLELIKAFENINNVKVPYSVGPRRAGDPIAYYATAKKAQKELGWKATKTIEDAVRDAWAWQQKQNLG